MWLDTIGSGNTVTRCIFDNNLGVSGVPFVCWVWLLISILYNNQVGLAVENADGPNVVFDNYILNTQQSTGTTAGIWGGDDTHSDHSTKLKQKTRTGENQRATYIQNTLYNNAQVGMVITGGASRIGPRGESVTLSYVVIDNNIFYGNPEAGVGMNDEFLVSIPIGTHQCTDASPNRCPVYRPAFHRSRQYALHRSQCILQPGHCLWSRDFCPSCHQLQFAGQVPIFGPSACSCQCVFGCTILALQHR